MWRFRAKKTFCGSVIKTSPLFTSTVQTAGLHGQKLEDVMETPNHGNNYERAYCSEWEDFDVFC